MTRQEKIQTLKLQIEEKQEELDTLKAQLGFEMVANFNEMHGLNPGQHFMYGNKECVGVESNGFMLKTHAITKSGDVDKIATIIYDENNIKPL